MKQFLNDKEQAFRYFLGELDESEQTAVEQRFFADEDFSRFLDRTENLLIEDYVGGKLDFNQRQNFEHRFLISERRREKTRATQVLSKKATAAKVAVSVASSISLWQQIENLFSVRNLAWASGLAAIAICAALLGGLWLENSPEKNQTARVETEKRTTIESVKPALPSPNSDAVQKTIVARRTLKTAPKSNSEKRGKSQTATRAVLSKPLSAFTLLPPMQSAGNPSIVKRALDAEEKIRLRVVYRNAESFAKYRVEIHAADGDLLWSREIAVNRKTAQKPLALAVRSGALGATGSYELTVSGATGDGRLEEINNFNFFVQK